MLIDYTTDNKLQSCNAAEKSGLHILQTYRLVQNSAKFAKLYIDPAPTYHNIKIIQHGKCHFKQDDQLFLHHDLCRVHRLLLSFLNYIFIDQQVHKETFYTQNYST